jgi:hypothetical protein
MQKYFLENMLKKKGRMKIHYWQWFWSFLRVIKR